MDKERSIQKARHFSWGSSFLTQTQGHGWDSDSSGEWILEIIMPGSCVLRPWYTWQLRSLWGKRLEQSTPHGIKGVCACVYVFQSVLVVPKQLGYRENDRDPYRRTCHERGRTLVLGVQCTGDSRNQEKPTLDVSSTDTQIQQDSEQHMAGFQLHGQTHQHGVGTIF